VFATPGTIASRSYDIEIAKLHPSFVTTGHACPMWVPLVECGDADSEGADFFVKRECDRLMAADEQIDTVILGCTHYPLLYKKIRQYLPEHVNVLSQGAIVADSLADYLTRHPEMRKRLSTNATAQFLTTESPDRFDPLASLFLGEDVASEHVTLA
jgi:glutamate racemase